MKKLVLPLLAAALAACNGQGTGPARDASSSGGAEATRAPVPSPTVPATAAPTSSRPPLSPSDFDPERNLFLNPSFEEGREPWWSFVGPKRPYWADFTVSADLARTGDHAARLELTSRNFEDPSRIFGVIQEVTPDELPRRLSAWYRVESWQRGTRKQYAQVVVVLWEPKGMNTTMNNIQIAYVLAGVTSPPLSIGNRRFVLLGPEEPERNVWLHLERDLHADFERSWGSLPTGLGKIRVLFEARYDGRQPTDPEAGAVVYYDDLYLGP